MFATIIDDQFCRGFDFGNQRDKAISRRNDEPVVLRHHALRVAKKREHAQRKQQQRPANDFPVETEQENEANDYCDNPELASFGMDGGP